jgi:hypothetical protein
MQSRLEKARVVVHYSQPGVIVSGIRARLLLFAVACLVPCCQLGQGPDSIFSGPAYTGSSAGCTQYCHNGTPLRGPNPLLTGRHRDHIEEGKACGACHYRYVQQMTHMDSTLQTAGFVLFDSSNPNGQFNDGTRRCSNLDCHGSETW